MLTGFLTRAGATAAALLLASTAGLAQTGSGGVSRRGVDWRVPGAAGDLEAAAPVEIVLVNALPASATSARYGIVQWAVYLFRGGGVTDPFAAAAASPGFARQGAPWSADGGDGRVREVRITVEPDGITPQDYEVGVVLGRGVRVHAPKPEGVFSESSPGRIEALALRADPSDLADRRRWAPETLLVPGGERSMWQGPVPAAVDRIYVDYLVTRTEPPAGAAGSGAAVGGADAVRSPEGGILRIPPTSASAVAGPTPSAGPVLERPAGERILPLTLRRGQRNRLEVRAWMDATGAYRVEVRATGSGGALD